MWLGALPLIASTTIIFPARNDSWIVGAASRSYYDDLPAAGVQIFEFEGGLLHTKSLTLDGEVTLIGSANMDRRSFNLNYENSMLIDSADVTAELDTVQQRAAEFVGDDTKPRSLPSGVAARYPQSDSCPDYVNLVHRGLWQNITCAQEVTARRALARF